MSGLPIFFTNYLQRENFNEISELPNSQNYRLIFIVSSLAIITKLLFLIKSERTLKSPSGEEKR